MLSTSLSEFFKPESRKNGEDLFRQDLVRLSVAGDTQIQAFIKSGTGAKVSLMSSSISSRTILAKCSCNIFGAKGVFCKHLWATLLATEKKHPDFLESKIEIIALEIQVSPEVAKLKARQSEFRKAQNERLKQRNKELRLKKKAQRRASKTPPPLIPSEVQSAFLFFSNNGFSFSDGLTEESLQVARKKLARVFHPDLGGSHNEILALNFHTAVLLKSLRI